MIAFMLPLLLSIANACDCQNFIDVLGMNCQTIEKNYDVNCVGCDCPDRTLVLTTTTTNTTANEEERANFEYQSVFYISLTFNAVSFVLLIVSECMGAQQKSKFNGIIDAFKRFSNVKSNNNAENNSNVEMPTIAN